MPKKNEKHGKHTRNYKNIKEGKSTQAKKTTTSKKSTTKAKKSTQGIKKTSKSSSTKGKPKTMQSSQQGGGFKRVSIYVVAIIGIIAIIYLALALIDTEETITEPEETHEEDLVASVNDENLYDSEVQERLRVYEAQYGPTFTEEMAINETITEMLLLQKAEEKGIEVSGGEVDSIVNDWVEDLRDSMTEEQMEQQLAQENLTMDEYIDELRNSVETRLLMAETLEETALSDIGEEEAEKQREAVEGYVDNLWEEADITFYNEEETEDEPEAEGIY